MGLHALQTEDTAAVIAVLQQSLTPAFLLVALGSLLNLITARLSRIVDRARVLEELHGRTEGEYHARVVHELRLTERRMTIVGNSILLGVLAAVVVCLVIVLLFLQGMMGHPLAVAITVGFLVALLLLAGALLQFTREVFLSMRAIHVREALLEREDRRRGRQ